MSVVLLWFGVGRGRYNMYIQYIQQRIEGESGTTKKRRHKAYKEHNTTTTQSRREGEGRQNTTHIIEQDNRTQHKVEREERKRDKKDSRIIKRLESIFAIYAT